MRKGGKSGLITLAVWVATSLGFVPTAGAHSVLDHATPAAGSTVHRPPAQIKLRFTERIEPVFSAVHVLDPRGKRVDVAAQQYDPSNAKELVATVPPLDPGTYRVKWRVLSVDNHVNEGTFTFTISR